MLDTTKVNGLQIYTGVDDEYFAVFDKFHRTDTSSTPGFYTDFTGVKTRLSYFGIENSHHDKVVGDIPFPDDGLHAEAIEYVAALFAVDTSTSSFTAVELGAGYGPWLTFSAKAAQHKGISKINLVAVEADRPRLALLRTHFGDNGLPVPDQDGNGALGEAHSTLIHGAISDANGTLTFGSSSMVDWGAAPMENGQTVDFRGLEIDGETVNAYTIEHVIKDLDRVDFLHMDIQGFEARAVRASLDALKSKVRVMLIGTHTRQIEGELMATLFGNGWRILFEKPCRFERREDGNLMNLTTADGTQVWVNIALENERRDTAMKNAKDVQTLHYERAESMRREAEIMQAESRVLQYQIEQARRSVEKLEKEVAELRQSTSWKITSPLRTLISAFRRSH